MEWFLICLQKYATFSGRARRSEYWYFSLFQALGSFLWILLVLLASGMAPGRPMNDVTVFVLYAYFLATFLPSLAVSVRRLHDIGRSGWWYLLGFVPFGGLALLVFYCCDSQPGANAYGPNPKDRRNDPLPSTGWQPGI